MDELKQMTKEMIAEVKAISTEQQHYREEIKELREIKKTNN